MKRLHYGPNVPFGCVEPKPLKGFPVGRTRVRIRNTGFASVYVKTEYGIRHFTPVDKGGHWEPLFEVGRNDTATKGGAND